MYLIDVNLSFKAGHFYNNYMKRSKYYVFSVW